MPPEKRSLSPTLPPNCCLRLKFQAGKERCIERRSLARVGGTDLHSVPYETCHLGRSNRSQASISLRNRGLTKYREPIFGRVVSAQTGGFVACRHASLNPAELAQSWGAACRRVFRSGSWSCESTVRRTSRANGACGRPSFSHRAAAGGERVFIFGIGELDTWRRSFPVPAFASRDRGYRINGSFIGPLSSYRFVKSCRKYRQFRSRPKTLLLRLMRTDPPEVPASHRSSDNNHRWDCIVVLLGTAGEPDHMRKRSLRARSFLRRRLPKRA